LESIACQPVPLRMSRNDLQDRVDTVFELSGSVLVSYRAATILTNSVTSFDEPIQPLVIDSIEASLPFYIPFNDSLWTFDLSLSLDMIFVVLDKAQVRS